MCAAGAPAAAKLPTGNQYRWLWRMFGVGNRYKRTPLPPKPYDDKQNSNVAVRNRGYEEQLASVDPERPHWRDPKFESRQKTPILDLFGFNRNYSYTMFKFACLLLVGIFVMETKSAIVLQDHALQQHAKQPTPDPAWARDDVATERELRAAGFALVGYKALDNVGVRQEETAKQMR